MGEWGNGRMGEWENGRMGEWETTVLLLSPILPFPHSPIPPILPFLDPTWF